MNVQKIPTEGDRIDRVRNAHRLYIEVDAVPVNGTIVQGHRVLGTGRVEIYADRLDAVLADVRTEEHARVHLMASEVAERARVVWREQNADRLRKIASAEERAAYEHLNCNEVPELYYHHFGARYGLPPLRSCHVVHPETDETMDARAWLAMPAEKRAEWLVEPPITPENANTVASKSIADAIAKALAVAMAERNNGGNHKR